MGCLNDLGDRKLQKYEYRVVPAPKSGKRVKGVKGAEGRFAHALQVLMNEMGAEGWDYLRTDTLPSEERSGLTGKVTVFQNMLVFRRPLETAETADAPEVKRDPVDVPSIAKVHAPALHVEPVSQPAPTDFVAPKKPSESEVAAE